MESLNEIKSQLRRHSSLYLEQDFDRFGRSLMEKGLITHKKFMQIQKLKEPAVSASNRTKMDSLLNSIMMKRTCEGDSDEALNVIRGVIVSNQPHSSRPNQNLDQTTSGLEVPGSSRTTSVITGIGNVSDQAALIEKLTTDLSGKDQLLKAKDDIIRGSHELIEILKQTITRHEKTILDRGMVNSFDVRIRNSTGTGTEGSTTNNEQASGHHTNQTQVLNDQQISKE